MSKLRLQIARNTLITVASYLLSVLIALLLTPMVLHGIGTAGYGAWLLIVQLTGYAGLMDLGMQPAVAKAVAESQGSGDKARLRRVVGSALAFNVLLALCAVAIFFSLSGPVLNVFHWQTGLSTESTSALRWVSLGLACTFPASMFTALLKGTMRFDQVGFVQILVNLTRAGGTWIAIHFGTGLVGLAQAALAANVVALFVTFFLAWRTQQILPWRPLQLALDEWKKLVSFSFMALIAHGGWFLAYASDSVVIGMMISAADIAYFGLPVSVCALVTGVAGTLAVNFLPLASRLQASGETEVMQRSFLSATRYSLMIAVPMMLAIVVFGPVLLSAWLGIEFATHASPVLRILAFSYLGTIASGPATHSALGMGMQNKIAKIFMAEGVINLMLSVAMARPLGVTGVALGTLVPALFVHGFFIPRMISKKLALTPITYYRSIVWPVALPLLAAAPAAFGLHAMLGYGPLAVALFSTLASSLVYWTAAWFTCFDSEQRNFWRSRLLGIFHAGQSEASI